MEKKRGLRDSFVRVAPESAKQLDSIMKGFGVGTSKRSMLAAIIEYAHRNRDGFLKALASTGLRK